MLGACETQKRLRIDLAGRPSLRIKPGDLILNRQNDAMLLQIFAG
ncbi:transaldolase B [Limnobacter sp. MED105]|nr:transaldolase B [Limnobacter sp. MED105]